MATRRPDNSRSECGGRLIVAVVRAVADKGYAATTISDVVDRAGVSRRTCYEQVPDKETASSRRSTPAWRSSSRGWASRPCLRLARFARRNVPAAHRRHGRVDPRIPAGLGRSAAAETHRARRTGHIQAACRRLSSEPEESNTGGGLPTGRALAGDPGATQAAIWARELKPSLVTRFSRCPSPVRASRIGDATGPRRRAPSGHASRMPAGCAGGVTGPHGTGHLGRGTAGAARRRRPDHEVHRCSLHRGGAVVPR